MQRPENTTKRTIHSESIENETTNITNVLQNDKQKK